MEKLKPVTKGPPRRAANRERASTGPPPGETWMVRERVAATPRLATWVFRGAWRLRHSAVADRSGGRRPLGWSPTARGGRVRGRSRRRRGGRGLDMPRIAATPRPRSASTRRAGPRLKPPQRAASRAGPLKVYVKMPSGQTSTYAVDSSDSIGSLKKKIGATSILDGLEETPKAATADLMYPAAAPKSPVRGGNPGFDRGISPSRPRRRRDPASADTYTSQVHGRGPRRRQDV